MQAIANMCLLSPAQMKFELLAKTFTRQGIDEKSFSVILDSIGQTFSLKCSTMSLSHRQVFCKSDRLTICCIIDSLKTLVLMLHLGWRYWVTDLCSSMEVASKSLIASFLKASAQRQNSLYSKMPSLSCINAVKSVYKRASWKKNSFLPHQAFACQCQSTLMLWTLRSTSGMYVFEWPLFFFCHTIYPSYSIPSLTPPFLLFVYSFFFLSFF